MTPVPDVMHARRYLLGGATEEESTSLERTYFGEQDALEVIESAEEELIDDYLEDQFTEGDRVRFERHYLATPGHRVRLETIRRLKAAARRAAAPIPFSAVTPRARPTFRSGTFRSLAWAAGIVIAVGGTVWVVERARAPMDVAPTSSPVKPTTPAQTVPRAFAMSLSPVAVRSAGDSPALVIPAGTDVIDLRLEGETADKPVARGRIAIRTVSGDETWQGPTADVLNLPAGVIAHAEVPASRLRPDDYLVALYEIGATGVESERLRYFLRVRSR